MPFFVSVSISQGTEWNQIGLFFRVQNFLQQHQIFSYILKDNPKQASWLFSLETYPSQYI